MNSVGSEASKRARRGERYVPIRLPADIKEFNDSDDFLLGIPSASAEISESTTATETEDFDPSLLVTDANGMPSFEDVDIDNFDISSFSTDTSANSSVPDTSDAFDTKELTNSQS